MAPLTPEQIQNWRNVLFRMIGPWAFMASVEQIVGYRDSLQRQADQYGQEAKEPPEADS